MTQVKYALACALSLGAVFTPMLAALQSRSQDSPTPVSTTKKQTHSAGGQSTPDEGQKVFEQNCARCHYAPEGFSPRISGTVVRHMRVRASLSQHDEEQLLHFFNP